MTRYGLDDAALDALAFELEEIADAVPGVAHIYQPRATLPALHAARKENGGDVPPPPPRVEICDDNTIALTIATDAGSPSPDVAHRLHDALFDRLHQGNITVDRIDIRIARVD